MNPRLLFLVPVFGLLLQSAQAGSAKPAPEADCALLLTRTQAFSDAGQRSDGAGMASALDPRVIFFNEGGDRASAREMSALRPAADGHGPPAKMSIVDWNCALHGRVAVASFIDEQEQSIGRDRFHARYRSVETWLRSSAGWRMIGSATIALNDDPPAVDLPASALDEYAGTYEAASGQRFSFYRRGPDLVAETTGGPPTVQKAEVKDIFFTPGRARFRKVFQRDPSGRIVAFAVRREGHDVVFHRLSA
jgi:hypothetical protein